MPLSIKIGARDSALSQAQVWEVHKELNQYHEVDFDPIWVETTGDRDQKTSLRDLDKTDFFTREIDQMLHERKCRIGVHSAKDLPEPLPKGLAMIALTKGVDPSDVLVFNKELPLSAKIGTSSLRREQSVKQLRGNLQCEDIRGNILQRLALLDEGVVDGLVIAEAALIRLNLTHRRRIRLEGDSAPLQGKLAVIARSDDHEMIALFKNIHDESALSRN